MTAKRALVVDDSKSARVVLSRMLEKYGIEVDTADSAETALEYLKSARPDAIFMDHLMPGIDGLEAVKLIKADPATATIPIMMYTSQEGELYVGQARALGAMGVLPKSVRPIDVTKVLYQLGLLPDRRDFARSVLQPVDENGTMPAEAAPAGEPLAMDPRMRGMIEALLKEQSLELRRFVVASLDSHAQRLVAELRPREPAEPGSAEAPAAPMPPPSAAGAPWGWVAAAVLLVGLVMVGLLYWQSLDTARRVDEARARLEAESAELRGALDRVRAAANVPLASAPPEAGSAAQPGSRRQVLPVPYGEAPLAPARLEALRALVAGLEQDGFSGTVRVETVPGVFCLTGDAEGGYSLAEPGLPANRCDLRGNPYDESLTGAARQPVAFANLASSLRGRTEGGIELVLAQGSADRVVVAYPESASATAGEWNAAAQANSRVEVTAQGR
ncbi:MAG: response regulator [Steroidobacteraceae bacterium]|nr:response regulator [Steroidobacteraceae bacterium]